jgi:hypothetical protein
VIVAGLIVWIVAVDIPVVGNTVTVYVAVSFVAIVDAVAITIGIQRVNRFVAVGVDCRAGCVAVDRCRLATVIDPVTIAVGVVRAGPERGFSIIVDAVTVVVGIEEVRRPIAVSVCGSLLGAAIVELTITGLVVGIVAVRIAVVGSAITVGIAISLVAVAIIDRV